MISKRPSPTPRAARATSSPSDRIVVRGGGATLVDRQATLDCVTGDPLQIRERLADGTEAITDLVYFPSGLLQSVTGPANLHGQRYQLTYEYDARTSTHVTRIADSFGLVSGATYDLRFGSPLSTTDENGNDLSYAYDDFGRIASVTGPYEIGSGTTAITFEYHPRRACHGRGRVTWTSSVGLSTRSRRSCSPTASAASSRPRWTATIHTSPTTPSQDVMIVSGRTRFDGLGRAVEQFQPTTEPLGSGPTFNRTFDAVTPSGSRTTCWTARPR